MQKITNILSGVFMLLPTAALADSVSNEYLSDWWHQSINVVGSNSTRFGPLKEQTYIQSIVPGLMWIGLISTVTQTYLSFLV
jgi:nucleoside-specific outer membrane channel protein Tsx